MHLVSLVKDIAMNLDQMTNSAAHIAGQTREAVGEFADETLSR